MSLTRTWRWLRMHSARYWEDMFTTKVRKKNPMLMKTPTAVPAQLVDER